MNRPSTMRDRVLDLWAEGEKSSAEIAAALGLKRGAAVRNIIARAREQSGGTEERAKPRPSRFDFPKAILRVKESAYGKAKVSRQKARHR
jgi:hypothetical protein